MEPPLKRRRTENPLCSYYNLLGTIIPILGIDPRRDLDILHNALVPDMADPETIGLTEDNPLHVPASLAKVLLAAPNATMKLSAIIARLESSDTGCRDPELLAIIYDLCASINTEAAACWTRYYDAIVDSICRDDEPSNACLPHPESIVEIAQLVAQGAYILEPYFNRTYNLNDDEDNPDYCAWEIMEEAITATGSRRAFLNRVLLLGNLRTIPEVYRDAPSCKSMEFLDVYWRWRSGVVLEENEYANESITFSRSSRGALCYESTRALFSNVVHNSESEFIVFGTWEFEGPGKLDHWLYEVVDPDTGKIMPLNTCAKVWTPEFVDFIVQYGITAIPDMISQFALRTLPAASIAAFTSRVFNVHPLCIQLLNAAPRSGRWPQ